MIRRAAAKPRLSIASPWPPQGSGVADYAARLAASLAAHYEIDAYHDPSARPELSPFATLIPAPLLARLRPFRRPCNVLYQMGNSPAHAFLYPTLLVHPGVVTLHDPCLTHFHEAYRERPGVVADYLEREIAHDRPGDSREIVRLLPSLRRSREGVGAGLAARGIDLNRRIVERSLAVVVHSRWACDRMCSLAPEYAAKIRHIPFPAPAEDAITPQHRHAVRARLGLPLDGVVFASLGFLSHGKMNCEAIEAFAAVARGDANAVLIFAGQSLDGGAAEGRAAALGLGDRARFLGRLTPADYHDLAGACDVGVNLRRPPTNGETSAALLDLLRRGIPTIVTDVDAFNDEPDEAVVRVRWRADGIAGLIEAMRRLANDASLRLRVGEAARDHVRCSHRPDDVTSLYVDAIESTAHRAIAV